MKKLIFKAVLMVGIMIGISNYMLYIMTGKSPFSDVPKMDFSFSPPTKEDVTRTLSGGKEKVYKWTDENGATHYSSEPPPETQASQEMIVDPNVNLVQGVEIPKPESEAQQPATQNLDPLKGGVYNPESIKKLMDDAKNVQNLMNERNEALKEAAGDM